MRITVVVLFLNGFGLFPRIHRLTGGLTLGSASLLIIGGLLGLSGRSMFLAGNAHGIVNGLAAMWAKY